MKEDVVFQTNIKGLKMSNFDDFPDLLYSCGDDDTSVNNNFIVDLTSIDFLTKREKQKRLKVGTYYNYTGGRSYQDDSTLVVFHDKYNRHDDYALKVMADDIFIGYIRKKYKNIDKTDEINNYCFHSGYFEDISIQAEGKKFILTRFARYGSNKDTEYQHHAYTIMYKNRNIIPLATEEKTIEDVLENKNKHGLSQKDIVILESRLTKIRFGIVRENSLEFANETLYATDRILGQVFGFIGRTLKKSIDKKNNK